MEELARRIRFAYSSRERTNEKYNKRIQMYEHRGKSVRVRLINPISHAIIYIIYANT